MQSLCPWLAEPMPATRAAEITAKVNRAHELERFARSVKAWMTTMESRGPAWPHNQLPAEVIDRVLMQAVTRPLPLVSRVLNQSAIVVLGRDGQPTGRSGWPTHLQSGAEVLPESFFPDPWDVAAPNGEAQLSHPATCDNCGMGPIVGKRFKCDKCDDYDLCESCHTRRENIHNIAHTFTRIDPPRRAPVIEGRTPGPRTCEISFKNWAYELQRCRRGGVPTQLNFGCRSSSSDAIHQMNLAFWPAGSSAAVGGSCSVGVFASPECYINAVFEVDGASQFIHGIASFPAGLGNMNFGASPPIADRDVIVRLHLLTIDVGPEVTESEVAWPLPNWFIIRDHAPRSEPLQSREFVYGGASYWFQLLITDVGGGDRDHLVMTINGPSGFLGLQPGAGQCKVSVCSRTTGARMPAALTLNGASGMTAIGDPSSGGSIAWFMAIVPRPESNDARLCAVW
eukprot:TRINITY_DN25924_c0_g1_i4.p1 TRINITY_DN25924_c0_g1~~TRINITY_DN25924_c0_g1_i4.p1  ORF type:complete len:454 (-),score=25.37 TRINITY_DN25924_c0_g1_i4:252-1613(-)